MWGAIAGAVQGVVGGIATYFTRRQEIKLASHQADLALVVAQGERQAKLAEAGLMADSTWEMEQLRLSSNSWRDEFVLLVLSSPLILCFLKWPGFDGPAIVAQGFDALGQTPTYFQGLLVAVYAATYGLRTWRRNIYDTATPIESAAALKNSLEVKRK